MWNDTKKVEAVTTYLILGNMPATAQTVGVPLPTLKMWRKSTWWKELELEIQNETDQGLDSKLAKRIEKALDIVNDRLENGDFQYDPKTGQFVRRPVNVRDGWKVASEMIDKRWLIRKMPKDTQSQEEIGIILKNLAQEFADMARDRIKIKSEKVIDGEVIDGAEPIKTELQERVPELPRETGTNQEPELTKPGA